MWATPKTNWQPASYVGVTDVNRIKNNISHLYGLAVDYVGSFDIPSMGSNFTIATDIKANNFNKFENALDIINKTTYEEQIGEKKTYVGNGFTIDYNELNRIEIGCQKLYTRFRTQDGNGGLDAAPVITVDTSGWTAAGSFPIRGTITTKTSLDFAKIYYTYNDEEVEKELTVNNDGTFIQMVPLQKTINTMRVKAVDSEGNVSAISFIKQRDSSYPTLTVTAPTSNSNTSPSIATSSAYRVAGTVSDSESGITSVKVNGNTATRSGNDWYYTLTGLQAGQTKTITITATNGAGLQTTLTRYVMFDATKPNVVITSGSGATTTRSYTLTGRVTDNESGIASVTVNGSAVSIDANGYFSKNYTLSEGNNTFTVSATDKAGNSYSANTNVIWVNPATDYGTNVNYNGSHSHQDSASGLSCRYSDDVDNDLNYSVHGSAAAVVNADFYHRYGANFMSLSVNVESGGDTTGSYEWYLMDTAGNVLTSYNSGAVGSGTYGITVNVSAYAGRTDVLLRVKVRSEVGDWVSAYSGGGWSATASMTGCTQSV